MGDRLRKLRGNRHSPEKPEKPLLPTGSLPNEPVGDGFDPAPVIPFWKTPSATLPAEAVSLKKVLDTCERGLSEVLSHSSDYDTPPPVGTSWFELRVAFQTVLDVWKEGPQMLRDLVNHQRQRFELAGRYLEATSQGDDDQQAAAVFLKSAIDKQLPLYSSDALWPIYGEPDSAQVFRDVLSFRPIQGEGLLSERSFEEAITRLRASGDELGEQAVEHLQRAAQLVEPYLLRAFYEGVSSPQFTRDECSHLRSAIRILAELVPPVEHAENTISFLRLCESDGQQADPFLREHLLETLKSVASGRGKDGVFFDDLKTEIAWQGEWCEAPMAGIGFDRLVSLSSFGDSRLEVLKLHDVLALKDLTQLVRALVDKKDWDRAEPLIVLLAQWNPIFQQSRDPFMEVTAKNIEGILDSVPGERWTSMISEAPKRADLASMSPPCIEEVDDRLRILGFEPAGELLDGAALLQELRFCAQMDPKVTEPLQVIERTLTTWSGSLPMGKRSRSRFNLAETADKLVDLAMCSPVKELLLRCAAKTYEMARNEFVQR